jgi:hypothetical protein
MPADPLRPLLDLPGVADAVAVARAAVDEVHRHRANRRGWPAGAAEASVRAARASAALDGGSAALPDDGPVADPVLAGSLRVAQSTGALLTTWERAPLQVLARLHMLAAADLVDEGTLGRPRSSGGVASRLDGLAHLVTGGTQVPGPVLAAVVHGELLALGPFGTADGVVARAAARLTAVSTGVDPKGLAVPEVSWLRRERAYRAAAEGFASGDPTRVGEWILLCCEAFVAGAKEATSIADAQGG